jgi:hypothetical protein
LQKFPAAILLEKMRNFHIRRCGGNRPRGIYRVVPSGNARNFSPIPHAGDSGNAQRQASIVT